MKEQVDTAQASDSEPEAASNPGPTGRTRRKVPQEIWDWVGQIVLWVDEEPEVFEDFLACVAEDALPNGPIEWILVRDYVLAEWRIRQTWRQRGIVERLGRLEAMTDILQQGCTDPLDLLTPGFIAQGWMNGQKDECRDAEAILKRLALSEEDVEVYASVINAKKLEEISRQESRLYARRDDALRQLEARRFGWAQRVKRRSEDVIEGEYKEANVPSLPPGTHGVVPS